MKIINNFNTNEKNICPVCTYELDFMPWNKEIPSDKVCPSCGIHFGYDDLKGGDFRKGLYHGWKNKWILDGKKFWRDSC